MSSDSDFTRREFVAGAIAVGSAFALSLKGQSALAAAAPSEMTEATPQLLVFDPEHPGACQRVESVAGQGCATLPVEGDRVRFAHALLSSGKAPEVIAGLTRYADFLLLSGCAAEHGYRVLSEQMRDGLVGWKIGLKRPSIYSS